MTEQPVLVTPLNRLPMSKALRELLAAVTGKPWEIGRVPTKANPDAASKQIAVDPVYGILYPLWTTYSGPPRRPNTTWNFQATVVAKRADQLEVWEHKVHAAIIGRTADSEWAYALEVDGMHVIDRVLGDQNTGGTGETPLTDVTTELPTRDVRFAITVNAWGAP